MKKLILLGASFFILSACSAGDSSTSASSITEQSVAESSKKTINSEDKGALSNPYSIGEFAEFNVTYSGFGETANGKIKVTINKVTAGQEALDYMKNHNFDAVFSLTPNEDSTTQWSVLNLTVELLDGTKDFPFTIQPIISTYDGNGSLISSIEGYNQLDGWLKEDSISSKKIQLGSRITGDILMQIPLELDGAKFSVSNANAGSKVWFNLSPPYK